MIAAVAKHKIDDGVRESDMMYELKIKDETVYFFVLLEFQSTVDRFMPVRMLTYIMLFYQDWLKKQIEYKRKIKQKEKKGTLDEADIEAIYDTIKLPAVFPILLYNGDRKWQPLAIPGSGCTRASVPVGHAVGT